MIGYPIDYYVRMNFDGFRQIIDLAGGVDITVAKDIKDDLYPDENYGYDPLFIPAGRQHMNGAWRRNMPARAISTRTMVGRAASSRCFWR